MKIGLIVCVVACLGMYPVNGQKLKKADKEVAARLSEDAGYMKGDTAADGNRQKVCAYASAKFGEIGLGMKGRSYIQVDQVDEGRALGADCALKLNGQPAVPGTEFFPLVGSPDAHAAGSSGISLNENGLPWFHDLRYDLEEGKGDSGGDIRKTVGKKAEEARKKGATALLLFNSSSLPDALSFDPGDKTTRYPLPVVYINKGLSNKTFKDPTAYIDVELTVSTREHFRDLYRVEGYINNGAAKTVVISAPLNADAGMAALIELGRMIKHSGWTKHNFLVLGFSEDVVGATLSKGALDSVAYVVNLSGPEGVDPGAPLLKVSGSGPAVPLGLQGVPTERKGKTGYDGAALELRYVYKAMETEEKK